MGLIQTIQRDIQRVLGNTTEFAQSVTLIAPTSPITSVTTTGTVKKHHTVTDELGNKVRARGNTINATLTVSTLTLNALNYPYRDSNGRVTFKGHKVAWTDVNAEYVYLVNEWYPDEVTGNISLELAFYA